MDSQPDSSRAGPCQIAVFHLPFSAITNRRHCPETEERANAARTIERYQRPVTCQWEGPAIHGTAHQSPLAAGLMVETFHSGRGAGLGGSSVAPGSRNCQYCTGRGQEGGNCLVIQLRTDGTSLFRREGVGAQSVLPRVEPAYNGPGKARRGCAVQLGGQPVAH